MKYKNKGFTLIELLAVIVILGIILTISTMSVISSINKSKENAKYIAAKEIIEIASAYMAANNKKEVTVLSLIGEGYLEEDTTNPLTGKNDLYEYAKCPLNEDGNLNLKEDDNCQDSDENYIMTIYKSNLFEEPEKNFSNNLNSNKLSANINNKELTIETIIRMFKGFIIAYTKKENESIKILFEDNENNETIVYNETNKEYERKTNEENKDSATNTYVKDDKTQKTTKNGTTKTSTVQKGKEVEKLSISGDYSVEVNKTITLFINILPSDATNRSIIWKSKDNKVAEVNNKGEVTGKKMGITTITATSSNGKVAEYKIGVTSDTKGVIFLKTYSSSDSILLKNGSNFGMIDVGTACDNAYIDNYLENKMHVSRLSFLQLTHADYDHIGGAKDKKCDVTINNNKNIGGALYIIDKYKPEIVYINTKDTTKYKKAISKVKEYGGKVVDLSKLNISKPTERINARLCYKNSDDITLPNESNNCTGKYNDTKIKIRGFSDWSIFMYNAKNNISASEANQNNANSIITYIIYKTNGKKIKLALFGDMSYASTVGKSVAKEIGKVNIFKVPHHGISKNSKWTGKDGNNNSVQPTTKKASLDILGYLKPKYAVITNKENSDAIIGYKSILKDKKVKSYYTAEANIIFRFNSTADINVIKK